MLMNISVGVFMNISKIKLVLLQGTLYSPENSSLPSAELGFIDAPEIKGKKKEKNIWSWDISSTTGIKDQFKSL